MDWPTVYAIYAIGFGIILLITFILSLRAISDKDVVCRVCIVGFVVAIFWPLVVSGLLLLAGCFLILSSFSLICRVIFR